MAIDRLAGLRWRRRLLIQATLADVAGGAHALSELDLADLLRRFGIPEPDRQASRRDQHGYVSPPTRSALTKPE